MYKLKEKLMCIITVSIYLISILTVSVASAETYKIPDKNEFNPNKAANEIESIVNNKSIILCNGTDNMVYINGSEVAKKHNEAVSEMQGYVAKLNKKGMYLNRELSNTVTVKTENISLDDFVEIVIDKGNLEKISHIDSLKIVLKNKNEYITLNNECINYIIQRHKQFRIQIKKITSTYIIRFLDFDNSIIDDYGVDIKLALPVQHSEQTVYLFMNNIQENWGGQYNSSLQSIEFMSKYSGEYSVSSPQINIKDIEKLSDYEKQAIRFMVVRGYFSINNNEFQPEKELTRYDFAEALVRMFFALDSKAVCSFPDVDKKHYRYVAASQKDNIVQGFDDGTFRGNEKVTVEQVIALAARTINAKNGYVYPENTDKYLGGYDNTLGEWAKKEAALAIREGIFSRKMNLIFSENITRKDAAVMLYRLFMIMNNTPEQNERIEYEAGEKINRETVWNKRNAVISVSTAILLNAFAGVGASVLIKRKRKG